VGQPPTDSLVPVPRLFYGILAVFFALAGLAIQIAVTSRSLYLSQFRWEWELLSTTFYLAKFVGPIALVAGYMAWRGIRLAKRRPSEYGGLKLCRASLALALLLAVSNVAAVAVRLPQVLENRRIRQQAYTQVKMYQLNEAIVKYQQQFGTYPRHLIDLQEMDPNLGPILDYWDHEFVYTPMSPEVASRGTPVPFQNSQIVSRGADGVLGTADDLVMMDGIITRGPAQNEALTKPTARPQPPPANGRRSRSKSNR
jgi:hypothetical protein